MRFISAKGIGASAAALVLLGCASAPPLRAPQDTDCFKRREINAITPLDDQHVFVKLSADRFALMTVEKNCQELRLARTVAISGSPITICGDGNTLISFQFPAQDPIHCRIERIQWVADKKMALETISTEGPSEDAPE